MRYFGARIPARALRAREAGGVFVQATRVLSLVRHAAHGRERRAPGRSGHPSRADPAAYSVRRSPRVAHAGAAHHPPRHCGVFA